MLELFTARTILVYLNLLRKLRHAVTTCDDLKECDHVTLVTCK